MKGKMTASKSGRTVLGGLYRSFPSQLAGMRTGLLALTVFLSPKLGQAAPVFPDASWRSADPQSLGWNTEGLAVAKAFSQKIGSSAVLIVQHGKILASWGDIEKPFAQHSVRKSFISALYGIYANEGKIDLFENLTDLGIDDVPRLTEAEKQALVVYLLNSSSDIFHDAAYETEEQKAGRPARGSHNPGTYWWYNNWDFNTLGTIFQKATGLTVYEAFDRRIAKPIGMQDYRVKDQKLWYEPASIHPAYPFVMSARDAARFGLLFLHKGYWKGTPIIPANWVDKSTSPLSEAGGSGVGYGYLWWVAPADRQFGAYLGPGSFSARGSGGNMILIAPAYDLVIVHEGDKENQKFVSEGDFGGLVRRIMDAAPSISRSHASGIAKAR